MNDEKWTPSLSPNQEWKLHNGEGKVPEWFIRWSDRVYEAAVEEERKRIAEAVKSFDVNGGGFISIELLDSIINKHQ